MRKELTTKIHIKIEDAYLKWDTLSEDKKKEIGTKLNDRALRAIGYVPVEEGKEEGD